MGKSRFKQVYEKYYGKPKRTRKKKERDLYLEMELKAVEKQLKKSDRQLRLETKRLNLRLVTERFEKERLEEERKAAANAATLITPNTPATAQAANDLNQASVDNNSTVAPMDNTDTIQREPECYESFQPSYDHDPFEYEPEPAAEEPIVPVHLTSYVHAQEREEYEDKERQRKKELEKKKEESKKARQQNAEEHLNWWETVEPTVLESYKSHISETGTPAPGRFFNLDDYCDCTCVPPCVVHLVCLVVQRKYNICKENEQWLSQGMQLLLDNGFCPVDKTLKVSFSFMSLKYYYLQLVESQTACYAHTNILSQFHGIDIVKEKVTKCCQQFNAMLTKMNIAKYVSKHQRFNCASCMTKDTLHLSIDGCFKLRRERRDPLINRNPRIKNFFIDADTQKRWSEELDFRMKFDVPKDDSCESNFKAAQPTLKNNKFDEKGVVGLFCARHGAPLLFLDIFTGERYGYGDILLLEYLKDKKEVKNVLFYYDICCKYVNHFNGHQMQSLLKKHDISINFSFVVPSMHVKAHQFPCPWRYEPKYITNNGLTDGETCERAWSYLGRFAPITKSMTSANRRDTLEIAIYHYFMKNLKNQEKNMKRKLGKVRVDFSKEKFNSFKFLIDKEENELGAYRKTLFETVNGLIDKEINSQKGKESQVEKLDRSIKSQYQILMNIMYWENQAKSQNDRSIVFQRKRQCYDAFEDLFRERKKFPDPPTERDVTNQESKFWARFSHDNDDVKNWKVLHYFDRLKEEEEMLKKELENINIFNGINDNDTGTDSYSRTDIDHSDTDSSSDVDQSDTEEVLEILLDLAES